MTPSEKINSSCPWVFLDSGVDDGETNMAADRDALRLMNESPTLCPPTLRFFQWEKPTVSFGHLMNEEAVGAWAKGQFPMVKRPTGGGVVLHEPTDLSVSILWSRHQGIFSEKPSACYKAIHEILMKALVLRWQRNPPPTSDHNRLSLWNSPSKASDCLASPSKKGERATAAPFSICYEKPVCNDVMWKNQKIVGGALRLTREAILYQGNIRLNPFFSKTLEKIIGPGQTLGETQTIKNHILGILKGERT